MLIRFLWYTFIRQSNSTHPWSEHTVLPTYENTKLEIQQMYLTDNSCYDRIWEIIKNLWIPFLTEKMSCPWKWVKWFLQKTGTSPERTNEALNLQTHLQYVFLSSAWELWAQRQGATVGEVNLGKSTVLSLLLLCFELIAHSIQSWDPEKITHAEQFGPFSG